MPKSSDEMGNNEPFYNYLNKDEVIIWIANPNAECYHQYCINDGQSLFVKVVALYLIIGFAAWLDPSGGIKRVLLDIGLPVLALGGCVLLLQPRLQN